MSECWTRSADPVPARAHYGLAVSCAKRFYGRGVAPEELIGEAEAALLWAAARFDPERGVRFSTYAIPFVLGALRELCRRQAPLHIPRQELRLLCAAEALRDDLRQAQGKEPTVCELAGHLGTPPEKLAGMLAARERMRSAAADPVRLALVPDNAESFEDWVYLKDLVRRLGKPYAQVLWLRFILGCSQQEIAAKFRVSQPQVSRWEKAGKEQLRRALST